MSWRGQDVCCLVDPQALDPPVRSRGEHLPVSRPSLDMTDEMLTLVEKNRLERGVTLSRLHR
ncbi:MAG: hypothetical protein JO057_04345 [Chloroflexi bacterium]|nr:hypothetical protein [Chloroflexota bacterium]